jgi:hypothetical protein
MIIDEGLLIIVAEKGNLHKNCGNWVFFVNTWRLQNASMVDALIS